MRKLVKITGEMEGSYIRVRLSTGEELIAPIITNVGTPIPSQKWVTDNKDNFLAVLDYKDTLNPSPIITGFFPVKGADSEKFSIFERLLQLNKELLGLLKDGKVMTQLGPQPLMVDTQAKLVELEEELKEMGSNIHRVKL